MTRNRRSRPRLKPPSIPAKSTAYIGLDQAARDSAAAWLPPGIAYADGVVDSDSADPELDRASHIDVHVNDGVIPRPAIAKDLPADRKAVRFLHAAPIVGRGRAPVIGARDGE